MVVALCAGFMANRDTVIPPHITPVNTAVAIPAPVYTFPFEQSQITMSSPVDSSVYAGAKSADKDTYSRGNISENLLVSDTYLSMINDPTQDAFYADLISALRSVREKKGLNDDEYLELITVFVQSIHYEVIPGNRQNSPSRHTWINQETAQTIASCLRASFHGKGTMSPFSPFPRNLTWQLAWCARERTIRIPGTYSSKQPNCPLSGVPTETLGGNIPLVSTPIVIPVGNGTKTYGSCEVEPVPWIRVLQSSEQEVKTRHPGIDAMKGQMDNFYQARDVNDYNLNVPLFNNLQNERLQYAEIHNYILDHQFYWEGTYEYVKQNLPS